LLHELTANAAAFGVVEDTLNEPMYMAKRWRRDPNVWVESICAENGGADPFDAHFVPIPQADKPDF